MPRRTDTSADAARRPLRQRGAGFSPSPPLSIRAKLAYGLGSAAFGIKEQGFTTLLMLYYNQVVGLPAAWIGGAIMIVMIVEAVSDPIIGHYSDHLRSRWGRRHPFMYASALPLAIGYSLLWAPPAAGHAVQFIYLLATAILVRVAVACYEIPSSTLVAEFTDDYNERTSISTYRALFLAIGSIGMSVFTLKVLLKATPENPVGQLGAAGYVRYGLIAALVMFACILLSSWGTHHRIPLLRQNTDTERIRLGALWTGLKAIVFDRALASVLLCMFFFGVAGGFATTIGTYVATYYWHLSADNLGTLLSAGVWGIILALGVVQLSKKFGKKETTVTLYSIALLADSVPVVLGLLGLMPTDVAALMPWLLAKNVLLVMCVLAGIVMGTSMVADVADHLQLKTGRRMEGLMFAALVMINKAVSGLGIFLSGLVLAAIRFPEKASPGTVPPGMADKLALAYVIGMSGFCLLAIAAIGFYPITREIHQRTLHDLKRREAAVDPHAESIDPLRTGAVP